MDKYRAIWKIGKGSYGEVYKYFDISSREIVAVKKITIEDEFDGVPSTVIREVSILKEMEHENIVRLLDVVNEKDSVYLVFEHLDMDLLKYIKRTQLAMKPHAIKNFLRQILSGVAYCHARKVLHRDLKPPNLLVDLKLKRVKIADFGLARTVGIPLKSYSNEVVTLCYRAPELLLGFHQYSSAIDMWSVGCIFGEMVTLNPIFPARSELDQLLSIFSILGTPDEETWPGVTSLCAEITHLPKMEPKDLAEVFQGLEPAGVDLLSKMLCLDPIKRITARDALKHEYLT